MAGHSKWTQIKHQKTITDQKRGRLFSKLLNAISVAAKTDPNPNFNPRLRSAIQKAGDSNVPNENIERAVRRAEEAGQNLAELTLEAYGPGGTAIIIEAITDSKNRTVTEVKKILADNSGKWADAGSVLWGFEKNKSSAESSWAAKFYQTVSGGDLIKLKELIAVLSDQPDVQKIFTNANFNPN